MHLTAIFQHLGYRGEQQGTACQCCMEIHHRSAEWQNSGNIWKRKTERGLHLCGGYSKGIRTGNGERLTWRILQYRNGKTTNFNNIYRMVAQEMHSEARADHIPNPLKNYQYYTQADNAKVRNQSATKHYKYLNFV